jgi:hypothetical protein
MQNAERTLRFTWIDMFAMNNLVKAVIFASCVGTVSANQVRELPLEKKVSSADIVFIGTVQKTGLPENDVAGHDYLAQVHIDTVLQGQASATINVRYGSGISELDPMCCKEGEVYVFFLRNTGRGIYESVNGPYGIYQVKNQRQSFDWQLKP